MKRFAPLALLLLAAACSEAPRPADQTSAAETAAPEAATARVALALDQEGLRAVNVENGSTVLVAFDQPEAQTVALVSRALGDEPAETGVNSDCGAGPLNFASWDDGLTLWSHEGRFVGWAVNREGPTTMGGIGVGSSRALIDESLVAEFSHGSMGKQFKSGNLHGVLHDGRVAHMWAGVSCNFG